MEELCYTPNLLASSLAASKNRTIGIIVSNLENPFFLDIYRSVETLAHQQGREVLIANTGYQQQWLNSSIRLMLGRRVSGLAVIVSEMEPSIVEQLTHSGTPVVLYDATVGGRGITNIRVNYSSGMKQMVEYLHSLGHRRIAYIGYPRPLAPTEARRMSFLDTMSRVGGTPYTIAGHTDGFVGGREVTRELLRSGFTPTAIVCVNDITAVGVLRELKTCGIAVPGQVSVGGFDNISMAEFISPSLTTIHIPRDRIGELVFESLVTNSGSSRHPGRDILIHPQLVVRESTGPLASD
jgi:LacI family transcriptional regulator